MYRFMSSNVKNILDLSRNEAECCLQNKDARLAHFNRYPGSHECLKEKISNYISLNEEVKLDNANIFISNGSGNAIDYICQLILNPEKGDKILAPKNTFNLIDFLVKKNRLTAVWSSMSKDKIDLEDCLNKIKRDKAIKLVYICNPNNPTGTYIKFENIKYFIENMPKDVFVLLDEAYIEFVLESHKKRSSLSLIKRNSNLIITRTFSKAWGLANLRVGYVIGARTIISQLYENTIPYLIPTRSLEIAEKVLACSKELKNSVKRINKQKEAIYLKLDKLKIFGISYIHSETNFIFIRLNKNFDSKMAEEFFHSRKITIKKISDISITFSVPSEKRVNQLLECLEQVNKKLYKDDFKIKNVTSS